MVFEKDSNDQNETNFNFDYLIEDFHLISKILKRQNENNFWTDFFNYLVRQVFENIYYLSENFEDVSINTIKQDLIKDYKLIFFGNLDDVN